jgi:hypothetical protein
VDRVLLPYFDRQLEVEYRLGDAIGANGQRLTWVLQRLDQLEGTVQRHSQQSLYTNITTLIQRAGGASNDLTGYELSVFSENGEDGVLVEIFRRIGRRRGCFVEIGANSTESNCIFLADALGWSGLIVDANAEECERIARKYRTRPDIKVQRHFVTAENIEDILRESEIPRSLDLLSVDVDGNDYWIWAALREHAPAVVVIEHNAALDPRKRLVQAYSPNRQWDGTANFGASVAALCELGMQKGYKLVHGELAGANLFFVREDLVKDRFDLDAATPRVVNYHLRLALYVDDPDESEHFDPASPSGEPSP